MNTASRKTVCTTAPANVRRPPPSNSTVARKIGAKIAPRLRTRGHVGGCAPPRPALAGVAGRPLLALLSRGAAVSDLIAPALSTVSFPSESISTRSYACRFSFARFRLCFCDATPRLCPRHDDAALADNGVDDIPCKVVGEVPPVGGGEQHDVGPMTRLQPTSIHEAEHVGGVHRHGAQRLFGREPELRARQRRGDREALAECAPGVEIGGERDDCPR